MVVSVMCVCGKWMGDTGSVQVPYAWVCRYVGVWVCGYVEVWACGCVGVRVCLRVK